MTLTDHVTKKIISRVLRSKDYRIEVINLINAEFMLFSVDFFKQVFNAKRYSRKIDIEWYKETFLNTQLYHPDKIAIHCGLNKKTIHNMFGTTKRSTVLQASFDHFESLYDNILNLTENEADMDLRQTISFNGESIELSTSEALVVMNVLSVKRAALRGGLWSTVGKQAEKKLMLALCKLYQVPEEYYSTRKFVRDRSNKPVNREVDFYLKNDDREYKCEVKLMGKGNPECADSTLARESKVFVADTLSQQNKNQCDQFGVNWVACRDVEGYKRFKLALENLGIPHTDYTGNLEEDLPAILDEIFNS